jgi:hypothetical protein
LPKIKATSKPAASTSMVKWDAKLAELAGLATKVEASVGLGGNFLSMKSGQLSYQGAPVPENKMQVIILHAIIENAFRPGAYDPENPQPPSCYAFGTEGSEMAPHPDAADQQHEKSQGCPQSQMGSAERGKGPACGLNRRRLALITQGDLENIDEAEMAFLSLSYFSTKQWAGYVRQLADTYKKPAFAFVTEIQVVPDPKAQFVAKFRMVDEINDPEAFEGLIKKYERAVKEIAFPYRKPDEVVEAPAKGQRRAVPVQRRVAASPVRRAAPVAAAVAPAAAGTPVKVGLRKPVKQPKY